MRKKAGRVPTATGDGKSKLTGRANEAAPQGRAGTPGPNPPLRGPSRGQAPASTSETADVFRQRTKVNELKRNCDQPVRFYRAGVNGSRAAQTPKARNDLKVPALVSTNIIVCGSCDRNVTRRIGLKTRTCRKEDGDGGRTLLRGLFRSVWGTNDGTKRDCESCELDQARLSARELTIVRRSIPLTQGLVKEAA